MPIFILQLIGLLELVFPSLYVIRNVFNTAIFVLKQIVFCTYYLHSHIYSIFMSDPFYSICLISKFVLTLFPGDYLKHVGPSGKQNILEIYYQTFLNVNTLLILLEFIFENYSVPHMYRQLALIAFQTSKTSWNI